MSHKNHASYTNLPNEIKSARSNMQLNYSSESDTKSTLNIGFCTHNITTVSVSLKINVLGNAVDEGYMWRWKTCSKNKTDRSLQIFRRFSNSSKNHKQQILTSSDLPQWQISRPKATRSSHNSVKRKVKAKKYIIVSKKVY